MLRDLKSGLIAVAVLTVVFGLALPALFTEHNRCARALMGG